MMQKLPQDEIIQIEGVNLLGYLFMLRREIRTYVTKNKVYDIVVSSLANAKKSFHVSICLWTLGVFSEESLFTFLL